MNKKTMFSRVHRLLFLTMIMVPAVPLCLAAGIGFFSYVDTTNTFATDAIEQVAVDHRNMITVFLDERRADLESILALVQVESLSGPEGQKEMGRVLRASGGVFQDMGIIDPEGIQTAYSGPYALVGKRYSAAAWYRETRKHGYYVSDVFLGYRNVPHFVVAVARRIQGRIWVLRATIDSKLFGRLVEQVSIGDSGEAYILNKDGVFQTDRRSYGDLLEQDGFVYPSQDSSVMTFTGTDTDVDYLFASATMNDGKWRLIVRQKKDEAFQSTMFAVYTVVLILLCGGVVIVVLAVVVSRRVLDTLKRQAEEVDILENQLLQAARLAELGEMAAGFAHEINNPLQVMKTDTALLELTLGDLEEKGTDASLCDEAREVVEQFSIQIGRCAAITREILRFGRHDAPELQPLALPTYIPEVGAMVQGKAEVHGIDLRFDVDENVPIIAADPGQLQQVLINLLNNAIYAVVDRHGPEGGEISVSVRNVQGSAVIRVADNGTGMSQDVQSKIFLPFYTTKPPGQGTGMGLPVCHTIIDSLGGELTVESTRGQGTTFVMSIPGLSMRR
ncbi:sensor histidine kinase [Pseudodesulfovibrio sp. JC047]|uniref:sensor histidine kinase n=1 Tax=Pseudodesulfovibrio sp. JC047 TaxID=2683199 RepID=UPI0013D388A5|nr:sensor histidine kinase [Pseudodesulfovibrio sp. JC047]